MLHFVRTLDARIQKVEKLKGTYATSKTRSQNTAFSLRELNEG